MVWAFDGMKRQSTRDRNGEGDEEGHDDPSDDHRVADRDRPDVEQRRSSQAVNESSQLSETPQQQGPR